MNKLLIGVAFLVIGLIGATWLLTGEGDLPEIVTHYATDAEFAEAKKNGVPWEKNGWQGYEYNGVIYINKVGQ